MPRKKTTRGNRASSAKRAQQTTPKEEIPQSSATPRVLYRSSTNKVIGGVAGGLGNYFWIDPTVIRIIFILLTIFGGSGILLYIVLWIILPAENAIIHNPRQMMKSNLKEMKGFSNKGVTKRSSRFVAGLIILILGLLILASNVGLFYGFQIGSLWPLILVAIGIAILARE